MYLFFNTNLLWDFLIWSGWNQYVKKLQRFFLPNSNEDEYCLSMNLEWIIVPPLIGNEPETLIKLQAKSILKRTVMRFTSTRSAMLLMRIEAKEMNTWPENTSLSLVEQMRELRNCKSFTAFDDSFVRT